MDSDRSLSVGCPSANLMVGSGANVSINQVRFRRGVVVTPVPAGSIISKVLVKAVNQKVKKDPKTFTLRNVNTCIVNSPDSLKKEIRKQLKDDIINGDFEVGYLHSNTVVMFRKAEDLLDIWKDLKGGQKPVLWCDGLKLRGAKQYRIT